VTKKMTTPLTILRGSENFILFIFK